MTQNRNFPHTIDWALRVVILFGVPAAIALIVLAEPLITSLFFYGVMTEQDVLMSAQSLQAYALGLVAFMLIKVLATGYFSRQDMKTPVRIGIWAMVANMVLNLLLIWSLKHVGLALATALSSWLNGLLLLYGLKKAGVYQPQPGWWLFWLRVLISSACMILMVQIINPSAESWMAMGLWERVESLSLIVPLGVFSYFALLLILGVNLRKVLKAPAK